MSTFFDDVITVPVMLDEYWGHAWISTDRSEPAMCSHMERLRNYTPQSHCNSTFWGELINTDILNKTQNKPYGLQTTSVVDGRYGL